MTLDNEIALKLQDWTWQYWTLRVEFAAWVDTGRLDIDGPDDDGLSISIS